MLAWPNDAGVVWRGRQDGTESTAQDADGAGYRVRAEVSTFQISGGRSVVDPRVGLLAVLTVSAVMIGGSLVGVHFWLRLACCLLPLLFLLKLRRFRFVAVYAALYAFAMLMEGAVFQATGGVFNILIVMVAGLISRFLAPIVMGYCVMQSTTVAEFIAGMERMHVPSAITIPLSVMFRFFPTIAEEDRAIAEAMRMRRLYGMRMGLAKRIELELVPVMMSTVRIADELSQAALTKGLDGNVRRTHICEVGFRARDYVLLVLLGAVLVLFTVF